MISIDAALMSLYQYDERNIRKDGFIYIQYLFKWKEITCFKDALS